MIKEISRNIRGGFIGFLFVSSLENCSLHTAIFDKKYDCFEKGQIDQNFSQLNSGLKEYVNKIYIVDEKHLRYANGHAIDGGIICLEENYNDETLFHESAHARHMALDNHDSDFSDEWKKIADFNYGKIKIFYLSRFPPIVWDIKWKDQTTGPGNGMMEPYSGKSIYEDAANFVEALSYEKNFENLKKECIDKFGADIEKRDYPLFFCNPEDERYQKKLDLLKKYNFLTEEEHKSLSEKLGGLYYLLEY